jgi:S-DNA-T family DNA segregation ATPase FtsK/SpoIIIE
MRLDEPEQTDMVPGDGSRDRGALAGQITTDPDLGAGIAYVRLEGNPDPVRVRAAWLSDQDIEAMCAQYAPSPRSTSPVSEMSHERAHDLADRRPVPGLRHRPLPDRRPGR